MAGTSEYGTNINSYISGDRTLAFDSFSGTFGARVADGAFNTLTLTGSTVTMANAELDCIGTWNLNANSTLGGVLSADALDLSGDELIVTGTLGSTETTLLTNSNGFAWDAATAVTLFGESAAMTTDGIWESDNYRLIAASGVLVVGRG